MSDKQKLSALEKSIMEMTFKASFLRAAAIIDKITQDDVLEMQAKLLAEGAALEQVSRIDRAHLAVAHLKACADGSAKEYAAAAEPSR